MLRSTLAKLLPLLLLLGLVAFILLQVFGRRLPQPADALLPEKGEQALERGDLREARRVAALLADKGYPAQAHYLRGRVWVDQAKQAQGRTAAVFPYEEVQQAAQFLLAGAGAAWRPPAVREAAWLSACLVQLPVPAPPAEQRDLVRALAEFARVQDDGPLGVEAAVLAAWCLLNLDQQRLVVEGLGPVVKQHPDHLEGHRILAACYMDLNNPAEAIRHLEAWGRLDPADGLPYRWIGFFHKDSGNTQEALAAYREALQRRLKPADRARVARELAEVLIGAQGDYQEALDTLAQLPESARDAPEVLTLRTECLWGLHRHDEAVRLVERALRKDPQLPEALLLRARMYLNEDRPKAAVDLLEKAVALDPGDDRTRQHLMEAYRRLGDTARAAEQQRVMEQTRKSRNALTKLSRQALKQPWNDEVRYQTALLCLKINRIGEARTWLQAALACNPANYRARRLLAQIARRPSSGDSSPTLKR